MTFFLINLVFLLLCCGLAVEIVGIRESWIRTVGLCWAEVESLEKAFYMHFVSPLIS